MIPFILYTLAGIFAVGVFLIWTYAGRVDGALLMSDPYMVEGCVAFKRGRGAWAWRTIQKIIGRSHYVNPSDVIQSFKERYSHIKVGQFAKLKAGTRYKITRPGSLVLLTQVRMDERILKTPNADFLQATWIYALYCDERGLILREEQLIFFPNDLEALSKEEQAHIEQEYQKPLPDLTPFDDGQIVEVPQHSLIVSYTGASVSSLNLSEPLKGIVDIADVQYGASLDNINQANSKPTMMLVEATWETYNFATRSVYRSRPKKVPLRRALCGPEYQVFIPKLKRHITVDRVQIKKREYDKSMLSRVVLSEDMHRKILAWAPVKNPKKLAEWGVGSGLLQGKSNIMLFSGPLGVGKTLLAEALAEYLEMPFYPFDAVELGNMPETLEDSLAQVAARAKRWGALVLWDEAEIYLENRNEASRESNAFVAVTLRYLESFEGGMLVIATNRPFIIDEGINSRVPVKIAFPSLTREKRKELWRTHLPNDMPLEPSISEEYLEKLAKIHIDGRQIRNAVLLAARRAAALNLDSVPLQYLTEAAEQIREDARALRDIKFEGWEKKPIGFTPP